MHRVGCRGQVSRRIIADRDPAVPGFAVGGSSGRQRGAPVLHLIGVGEQPLEDVRERIALYVAGISGDFTGYLLARTRGFRGYFDLWLAGRLIADDDFWGGERAAVQHAVGRGHQAGIAFAV